MKITWEFVFRVSNNKLYIVIYGARAPCSQLWKHFIFVVL